MIPVTLLTGFLGSGKTTLLNQLLKKLPLTAVVMNEFGEIGLDHRLLEETRGPLALLAGGCVCCQVQGALAPTLKNLWMARDKGELPAYERVIIETTGIADPAPILDALSGDRWLAARHRFDGVVTTVDAVLGNDELDAHFEALRQVAVADRLVITKTDLAEPDELATLQARLEQINPAAPRLSALHGDLAPEAILGAGLTDPLGKTRDPRRWLAAERYRPVALSTPSSQSRAPGKVGLARPGAVHDARIRSFSLSFAEPLDWSGVQAALEMLVAFRPRELLRMKALLDLRGEDGPVALHAVQHVMHPPVRLPAWPEGARHSQFVFIVCDMEEAFVRKLLEDFSQAAAQGGLNPPSVA
jgi:G3E family GTPase